MTTSKPNRSRRKPHQDDAGYLCSLKTRFGRCVIYDRHAPDGDWINADTRWVVAAYDHDDSNIALLECDSQQVARTTMKDARDGHFDWIESPTLQDESTEDPDTIQNEPPEPPNTVSPTPPGHYQRLRFTMPLKYGKDHFVDIYLDGLLIGALLQTDESAPHWLPGTSLRRFLGDNRTPEHADLETSLRTASLDILDHLTAIQTLEPTATHE